MLETIHRPGEIREMWVSTPRGGVSALFTDLSWVYRVAIPSIEGWPAANAYVRLNPVSAMGRPLHKLEPAWYVRSVADRDIIRRRWFLVDLDPKRPSGVSATDAEKALALERACAIEEALTDRLDWPAPVLADSGNGCHLLYRIDLPNDPGSAGLVRRCLEALAHHAGSDRVEVDRGVFNASRLTALYGTTKRKGEPTADRPHRVSGILSAPEPVEVVRVEQLEALAELAPKKPVVIRPPYTGPAVWLDLEEWLSRHKIPVLRTYRWTNHEGEEVTIYEIPCPFSRENPHEGSQARVWQTQDGKLHATCHHARCQGKGWRDLRARYEPGYAARSLNRTRTYAVRKETIPDA